MTQTERDSIATYYKINNVEISGKWQTSGVYFAILPL